MDSDPDGAEGQGKVKLLKQEGGASRRLLVGDRKLNMEEVCSGPWILADVKKTDVRLTGRITASLILPFLPFTQSSEIQGLPGLELMLFF